MTTQFQIGQTYGCRSVGDHTCIFSHAIIARTEKTVTLDTGKRCGIKITSEGDEYILPDGRYSMCPVFRASRPYEAKKAA